MIAPSSGRSTVHHLSDNGLRSSRESMGGPWAGRNGLSYWSPMVVYEGLMESLTLEIRGFVGRVERSDTHRSSGHRSVGFRCAQPNLRDSMTGASPLPDYQDCQQR